MRRRFYLKSVDEEPADRVHQSLRQAKKIVKDLEQRKNCSRRKVLVEYTQVLNHVIDATSKLETTSQHQEDSTHTTLPETVDSSDHYAYRYGGYQTESIETTATWTFKPTRIREHHHHHDGDDDAWSIASDDFLPLYMTDRDAPDESEFETIMMGYADGFAPVTINVDTRPPRMSLLPPSTKVAPPRVIKVCRYDSHGRKHSAPVVSVSEAVPRNHSGWRSVGSGQSEKSGSRAEF